MDFNFDFDKDARHKKFRKRLFRIVRFILEIAFVIVLAYFIVAYTIEQTDMLGDSMEVTLKDQDTILINKLAYIKNAPKRFDVVVFKQTGDEHSYYNVKRIIGLPGETIQIKDGVVYIEGELLEEPMQVEAMKLSGFAESEILLDEDEYFVLGDNRNNSEDSRFANIGNIVYEDIIGTAWIRINNFGFISKMNMNKDDTDSDELTVTPTATN